jgi:hypothetical protein
MRFYILILSLFIYCNGHAQFLAPFQSIQKQPKVQFDYWVYSTASTAPTTKAQMDDLFNTSNGTTTMTQSGKTNSSKIIDWQAATDLSPLGISLPNSATNFALKIQGTFIPLETGTYTFTLESDDAGDFAIEGNNVVTNYNALAIAALGSHTGTISLTAGKAYSYTIRMQQGGGAFGLRLYWKAPTQTAAIATGYTTNWSQNLQELVSSPDMDGSSADKAAPSAKYIQTAFSKTTDGVYWINLPVVGPTQIYCILNNAVDGGGWMMMMKATTGATFQYSSTYWTSINTLNPTDNTRSVNGDAKFNTMNYYAAKDIMALWPDIATSGGSMTLGSPYSCWSWLQNNFNNGVRITPVNFFSTVDRLFLGDANSYSGKGGQFSTQTDVRFYGFNYENTAFASSTSGLRLWTRWGFGYNENGGGLFPSGNEGSPDISGGIGVNSDRLSNYSAGDYVSCCQTVTGINRQARVEIYVR